TVAAAGADPGRCRSGRTRARHRRLPDDAGALDDSPALAGPGPVRAGTLAGDAARPGGGSMMPVLARALAAARRRAAMAWLLGGLPPVALLAWLGLRLHGPRGALLALAVLLPLLAFLAWRAWRRRDLAWCARQLDRRRDMEDSADLLLLPPAQPSPLQTLQAERLAERLRAVPPELREPWPWRALLLSALGSLACALLVQFWPA